MEKPTEIDAASEADAKAFKVIHLATKYTRIETFLTAYQLFHVQEKPEWSPKIDTEIQTKTNPLNKDRHEVSLTLLLTGKTQQGQSIFQIKLEQGGVFEVEGFNSEEEHFLLRGHALSQLYPYASARVNDLLIHAGFPAINMNLIDFVGLYQQQQLKEKELAKSNSPEHLAQTNLEQTPLQ